MACQLTIESESLPWYPALQRREAPYSQSTLRTVRRSIVRAVTRFIRGALSAGLASLLFWASLVVSLAIAGVAACPVNRWLIARGSGHAVVHRFH